MFLLTVISLFCCFTDSLSYVFLRVSNANSTIFTAYFFVYFAPFYYNNFKYFNILMLIVFVVLFFFSQIM